MQTKHSYQSLTLNVYFISTFFISKHFLRNDQIHIHIIPRCFDLIIVLKTVPQTYCTLPRAYIWSPFGTFTSHIWLFALKIRLGLCLLLFILLFILKNRFDLLSGRVPVIFSNSFIHMHQKGRKRVEKDKFFEKLFFEGGTVTSV